MNYLKTLKVAMIEPVGGHGGMDYYDFGLCDGLGQSGVDVALYTCDDTAPPKTGSFLCRRPFRNIFGTTHFLIRGGRYLLGIFSSLLSAMVERRKICHFHFFNVGWLQLLSIGLARVLMRRVVVTAHDVESFFSSLDVAWMNRWGYRIAHRVIAHNEISRHELVRQLGISPSKIDVIPHGNFLGAMVPLPPQDEARRQLGIPVDAKVLLFFGQIKEIKGLDVLLRAMPLIVKQHPDALLLIAGKAWRIDYSDYRKMMEELGISKYCVSHIRYIDNDTVPQYYAACDVVVLPYRRIYQSGVVLMTMSYEKPVLVSDIPGMLEVVTNDETGFVFRNGDSEDLAEQVGKIFAAPAMCNRVATQGMALMKQQYDWNIIGEKTKACYLTSLAAI